MVSGAQKLPDVTVIGLGYVGLPLAVALAGEFATNGLDVSQSRIDELLLGIDRTGEIEPERLQQSSLGLTCDPDACPPSEFYIVTVPTPIDAANQPDLSMVEAASRTVGGMLAKQKGEANPPIVIFESTVYPGVTEDICGPILEQESGLRCGKDFLLGYSPERINPGDREHTIDKITKVVSGQTPEALDRISALYGAITSGGVFPAASIKAAEAAKVIENAQRDINIAFMNEITQIFGKMDVSIWDVLDAARTKWNFLPFTPGLVGGHCIGVDPYYLAHQAQQMGHLPRVILSGRGVNDGMAGWVGDKLHSLVGSRQSSVLVLGATFKEDVPDIRNSKVFDLIARLQWLGHDVTVHDPVADSTETEREYGVALMADALQHRYDLVVLAVAHREYREMEQAAFRSLLSDGGLLADLKGALAEADWSL